MKTVLQRVTRAEVWVGSKSVAKIDQGTLLLVGVERGDTVADAHVTADKVVGLRMFPGAHPMDRSLVDVGGAALVVSQFTLAASLRKGRRPSFEPAEAPEQANTLYLAVAQRLRDAGIPVGTGEFGAKMTIELVNDGPATFLLVARNGTLQATRDA